MKNKDNSFGSTIMIKKRIPLLFSLVLAGVVLLLGPVDATTLVSMGLGDLTALSSDVVVGKVISCKVNVARDGSGRINSIGREITVAVDRYLKSKSGAGIGSPYVVVREEGGVWGEITTKVPGSPEYSPGEKVFLFLAVDPAGNYRTFGLSQGKFSIREESNGGLAVVGKIGKPLADGLGIISSEEIDATDETRMNLEEFETKVEGLIGLTTRIGNNPKQ